MTERAQGFGCGIMFATGLGRTFMPGCADQYVHARIRQPIRSCPDAPTNRNVEPRLIRVGATLYTSIIQGNKSSS